MKLNRPYPCLILTFMLALQSKVTRGQHHPILVGKSHDGTRYYVEPWPPFMERDREVTRRRTVRGIECSYKRPYLKLTECCVPHSNSREWHQTCNCWGWHPDCQVWVYTMNDVKGGKRYVAPLSGKYLFKTLGLVRYGNVCPVELPSSNPEVSAAKRAVKKSELFVTENDEEPAPNGVYYGFREDGLEATMKFDGQSRVKYVEVNSPSEGWDKSSRPYDELNYTMLGKAIECTLGKEKQPMVHLILEPVDPNAFDGSRESFSQARMNTIEGRPVDNNRLLETLKLTRFASSKPFMKVAPSESKGVNSRISRVFGNVRNAASRFRRRGDDGLKDQLLAEDDKDILEDYDREKIDGSRESFPHAPLDTVEGEPSTIESPADSFGTETKTKAVRSGIGGGFGRLRNSLSRLRKYGKDGRKYGRLDEGNAEEFAAHGH